MITVNSSPFFVPKRTYSGLWEMLEAQAEQAAACFHMNQMLSEIKTPNRHYEVTRCIDCGHPIECKTVWTKPNRRKTH